MLLIEAGDNLVKKYYKEGPNDNLKVKINLRKVEEIKDMKKIILYQEHDPKVLSRFSIKTSTDSCGWLFRDVLGIIKLPVAFCKPKSLKYLVMQSKIKSSKY